MGQKLLLLILAIVGTVIGWEIVNSYVMEISFGEFFIIELIISCMHGLYNRAKKDLIKQS